MKITIKHNSRQMTTEELIPYLVQVGVLIIGIIYLICTI